MLIGYMRVSKADGSQVLDLQRDALIADGVKPSHLYEDQASGKKDDRPGLEACLKSLREGDTLDVVWKLDRLGRNLRRLVNTIHDLMERKVGFRVLTAKAPTSTPQPRARTASCLASSPRWPKSSGTDPREEDDRWVVIGACARTQWRPTLRDADARQAAARSSRDVAA